MSDDSVQISVLLLKVSAGDREALDRLAPLVYAELRRVARRQLSRERTGHTLDSVALANEAFMNLVAQDGLELQNRDHFYGVSGNVMRRILVDYARARNAQKRGGGARAVPFDDVEPFMPASDAERLIALDDALAELAEVDDEAAKVVEQRYFAGATEEEAARALAISPATARRRWAFAKVWLKKKLKDGFE